MRRILRAVRAISTGASTDLRLVAVDIVPRALSPSLFRQFYFRHFGWMVIKLIAPCHAIIKKISLFEIPVL